MVHYVNFLGLFEYASAPVSLVISYMMIALTIAIAVAVAGWLSIRLVARWTTRKKFDTANNPRGNPRNN